MPENLENSAVAMGLEKVSFNSNPKEGQWQRIFRYLTIALFSHADKVMLKILQARMQLYMNQELQKYINHELLDVMSGFRKCKGTRDQIANLLWIIEKA